MRTRVGSLGLHLCENVLNGTRPPSPRQHYGDGCGEQGTH
jgi:hypothetical protein